MVLPDEIADAALDGDVDTVRRFLAQHPERVNDVSVSGDLALLTIAIRLIVDPETRECSPDFVRLLISSGANVNRRTRPEFGGPTPLHEACLLAYPVVLEALLRAGAYATLVTRGPTGQFEESQPLAILWGDSWRHFAEQTGRSEEEHLRCMYECTQLLLRAGHPLDFLVLGATRSLEYVIEFYLNDALNLARAVRAAQSTSTSTRLTPWQKYCLVPPKELLRLRSQIARGKAVATRSTPPHLARLFARSLPNEIAWRVLAFWNPRY